MKKLISLLLVFTLATAASFSAFGLEKGCDCGFDPIIYVYGFVRSELVANRGTAGEFSAFPPEAKTVARAAAKLPVPFCKYLATRNSDYLCDSLTGVIGGIMEYLRCDESGNSVYDVTPVKNTVSAEHGKGSIFYFDYDWRLDVYDNAALLNDYVEQVKAATGHSKVALVGESMGGAILASYLVRYGTDSASDIVMNCSAFYGITMVDELYLNRINIDARGLVGYVQNFTGSPKPLVSMINLSLTAVKELGLAKPLASCLTKTVLKIEDKLYADLLADLSGNMPGVWAFVSDKHYEEAKKNILDEDVNAELIKKIDRYHYQVRPKIAGTLKNALADGVNIMILSNYGKQCTPVTEDGFYQSDFLVDTKYSSGGAVCADFCKTFQEGYRQRSTECGHNHISPDNCIDASSCILPENTWFVKNCAHTVYSETMLFRFIYSAKQCNIFTSPDYPQYMGFSNNDFFPLTADNCEIKSKAEIRVAEMCRALSVYIKL